MATADQKAREYQPWPAWKQERVRREVATLRADRSRAVDALREIRDTDFVDNALDPQRAARIARAALAATEQEGRDAY